MKLLVIYNNQLNLNQFKRRRVEMRGEEREEEEVRGTTTRTSLSLYQTYQPPWIGLA